MSDGLDLDGLLAVAKAATPGPWRYRLWNGADQIMAPDDDHGEWPVVGMGKSYDPDEADLPDPHFMFDEDAEFIATFDPPTCAALVERLKAAERDAAKWRGIEPLLVALDQADRNARALLDHTDTGS